MVSHRTTCSSFSSSEPVSEDPDAIADGVKGLYGLVYLEALSLDIISQTQRDIPSCSDISTILDHFGPHSNLYSVFLRWEALRAGTSYELQRSPGGQWTARQNLRREPWFDRHLEICSDLPTKPEV